LLCVHHPPRQPAAAGFSRSNIIEDNMSDVARGTPAIAEALNEQGHKVTTRQALHLCVTGAIPVWKTGGRYETTRTALKKFYEDRTAAALARANSKQPQVG
jgi:hypothetical protein